MVDTCAGGDSGCDLADDDLGSVAEDDVAVCAEGDEDVGGFFFFAEPNGDTICRARSSGVLAVPGDETCGLELRLAASGGDGGVLLQDPLLTFEGEEAEPDDGRRCC